TYCSATPWKVTAPILPWASLRSPISELPSSSMRPRSSLRAVQWQEHCPIWRPNKQTHRSDPLDRGQTCMDLAQFCMQFSQNARRSLVLRRATYCDKCFSMNPSRCTSEIRTCLWNCRRFAHKHWPKIRLSGSGQPQNLPRHLSALVSELRPICRLCQYRI